MNPRLRFAQLPTPIEPMSRLTSFLNGPRLWIKRDDLTGVGMGGNKIRKLEYLIAEAEANGAKTLITTGAVQSNHCRQTAALAANLGFKCKLVLTGDYDTPVDGNLLLDKMFGADITFTKNEERELILKEEFQKSWNSGERPYLIPLGGSSPVGTLGYLTAFEEFLIQGTEINWIIIASSSGGTQAGLELGKRRSNWNGSIIGINIGSDFKDLPERIAYLGTEASDRFGKKIEFRKDEIRICEDYQNAGYGNTTENEIKTIQLFARLEGIILDPVYTARAAAGMIDLIKKGTFKSTDSVLFWHTGGIPAVFSERYSQLIREGY
jgi:D-cysteine desulfhydrase family pyridoxal phosphate-dependent enzyme